MGVHTYTHTQTHTMQSHGTLNISVSGRTKRTKLSTGAQIPLQISPVVEKQR